MPTCLSGFFKCLCSCCRKDSALIIKNDVEAINEALAPASESPKALGDPTSVQVVVATPVIDTVSVDNLNDDINPSTPPATTAPYQLHTPEKSPSRGGQSLLKSPTGSIYSAPASPVSPDNKKRESVVSKGGTSLLNTPEKRESVSQGGNSLLNTPANGGGSRASTSRNSTFSNQSNASRKLDFTNVGPKV